MFNLKQARMVRTALPDTPVLTYRNVYCKSPAQLLIYP